MADGNPTAAAAPKATVVGSNLDSLRRSNLSLALRLIHAKRILSRADLTQLTGLNRSTTATIASELESLGLVTVSEPVGVKKKGRPSHVLTPSEHFVAIAVNPELDALTVGVVAMGGRVLRSVRYENDHPPSAAEAVRTIAAIVAGMVAGLEPLHHVIGIGVAVPGLVRSEDGLVRLAPHLLWVDEPFGGDLAEATGMRVRVANDASCGVIAESTFGAGAGERDAVYLNGGASGIGGGIVIDGRLMTGRGGFAGEFGHTLVRSDGVPCHCGGVGCLETEVTFQALARALGDPPVTTADFEARLRAEYERDPAVRQVVDHQITYLSIAIRNVVNALNPSLIILGGFLGVLSRLCSDDLEARVRLTSLPGPAEGVRIVASELGRENLLIGAAEQLFEIVLSDPLSLATARARDGATSAANAGTRHPPLNI